MTLRATHATIFGIASLTILLDQISKWYLLYHVGMMHRAPLVITDFFSLVMVWNKGVSFGMLNHGQGGMPLVLVAVAVIISAILLRLALRTTLRWERVGYAMVIGGALGNVIDRLRFGAVADFFYVHWGELGWPAFNVADAAICVGVGVLLLMLLRQPSRP